MLAKCLPIRERKKKKRKRKSMTDIRGESGNYKACNVSACARELSLLDAT